MDGTHLSVNVSRNGVKEIGQWLNYLLQTNGGVRPSFNKHHYTKYPSVQGICNSFTYRDSVDNILKYPIVNNMDPRYNAVILEESATSRLMKLHQNSKTKQKNEAT